MQGPAFAQSGRFLNQPDSEQGRGCLGAQGRQEVKVILAITSAGIFLTEADTADQLAARTQGNEKNWSGKGQRGQAFSDLVVSLAGHFFQD